MPRPKPASADNPVPIVVDTREGLDYMFERYPARTIHEALPEGDYTALGLVGEVVIERKTRSDLLGCIGGSRERFERMLARCKDYRWAGIVVECGFREVFHDDRCGIHPNAVRGTLAAWQSRGIHLMFCGNRAAAEWWTFYLLERFWRDHLEGKQ